MSVKLWLFALDRAEAGLTELLDDREQARAARLRDPALRRRFVVRHGLLRQALAIETGGHPSALRFAQNDYGKPSIAEGPHFSLSHCGDIALCAIAWEGPIGCDIERRNPVLADRAVAARLFAPGEVQALHRAADWTGAFFDCWVRKEAVVKALGTGLSCPLDSFEIAAPPAGLALHGVATLPGHHAALAAPAGLACPSAAAEFDDQRIMVRS